MKPTCDHADADSCANESDASGSDSPGQRNAAAYPGKLPPLRVTKWQIATGNLILLGGSLTVLIAAVLLSVEQGETVALPFGESPLPGLCVARKLLGMDCPGCGLTRCFVSFAHGDVSAAWAYHPMGVLLFGILLTQVPFHSVQLHRIWQGRRKLHVPGVLPAIVLIFVLMLAQWAARLWGVF